MLGEAGLLFGRIAIFFLRSGIPAKDLALSGACFNATIARRMTDAPSQGLALGLSGLPLKPFSSTVFLVLAKCSLKIGDVSTASTISS
jgi:hypothetical protein